MSPELKSENIDAELPQDEALLCRIREFVADAADCALDQVGPDDDIYEGLGVDSLGGAAIFIDISYEFRVPEPTEIAELATLNTPAKLVAYVKSVFGEKPRVVTTFDQVAVPPDIEKMLSYGTAFRFVDSVILFEKTRLITMMSWKLEHPIVKAHVIDGRHIVPGVLLAEQAAQSALLFARAKGFVARQDHLLLSQLRCDFRHPAQAPIITTSDLSIRGTGHGHFGFVATCFAESTELAKIKGIASKVTSDNGNRSLHS
jgi:acyl carrier protein